MHILEMPEFRKLAEAYRNGYLSFNELKEELEWYWDVKLSKNASAGIVATPGGLMASTNLEKNA
jgi:hypothetical protein